MLTVTLPVPLRAGGRRADGARVGVLEDPLSWQPGERLYRNRPRYVLRRQAQARSAYGIHPVLGREYVEKALKGNLQEWSQAEHKHCTELQGQLESAEKGCRHPASSGEAGRWSFGVSRSDGKGKPDQMKYPSCHWKGRSRLKNGGPELKGSPLTLGFSYLYLK